MSEPWENSSTDYQRYLLSSGRSATTARTYASNITLFWRWCRHHECRPEDLDAPGLRAWLAERLQQVSPSRAHNDLAALRLYYAWLREDGYRDDDPTRNLRVKRSRTLPTEPLSRGELAVMLAVCGEERDRVLLLLLAHSGMRISELAALRAEDIDFARGTIKVTGKGDKQRLISPHPDVIRRLHAFVGMFPEGPIFLSLKRRAPLSAQQIRKIIYSIGERARVKGVHPHRFRSLFATEYMDQFGDVQALQGALGHESIETTARYAEYTRQRRALAQMQQLRLD